MACANFPIFLLIPLITMHKNFDLQHYPTKSNVLFVVPTDLLSAHIWSYRLCLNIKDRYGSQLAASGHVNLQPDLLHGGWNLQHHKYILLLSCYYMYHLITQACSGMSFLSSSLRFHCCWSLAAAFRGHDLRVLLSWRAMDDFASCVYKPHTSNPFSIHLKWVKHANNLKLFWLCWIQFELF